MVMRRLNLRFRVRRIMVVVAIVGVVLALAKYLIIGNRPGDILAAALGALDGHYTVYAEGYSESKFRSIRVGMTVRQVEDIMGPPLVKGQCQVPNESAPITPGVGPLDDIRYYTRGGKHVQQGTASHWQRAVLFRNGVVWGTDSTYWLD
jgi:hypothetical protein